MIKPDCTKIYTLLSKIPNETAGTALIFENHIISSGINKLNAAVTEIRQDSRKYLEVFADLHDFFHSFCLLTFNGDSEFEAAVDRASRFIINKHDVGVNAAEAFSKFFDQSLKKNNKLFLSEKDIEDSSNRMVHFISFRWPSSSTLMTKIYFKSFILVHLLSA